MNMLDEKTASGMAFAQKEEGSGNRYSESIESFLSRVDMKNLSADDAKRFLDPETVRKKHALAAARYADEQLKAGAGQAGATSDMNQGQIVENMRALISKTTEITGSDDGLSAALEKLASSGKMLFR